MYHFTGVIYHTMYRLVMFCVWIFLGTFGIAHASQSPTLKGKTVTWIIPFSSTGGAAEWSRFYAPLLSDALPGKPTVQVVFMPGAGSTKGANYFHNKVAPDGLTILGTSASTLFPYLLKDPRVRYDYKDWHLIFASGSGGVAYLPKDLGDIFRKTPVSLREQHFVYGSQGVTQLDLVPLLSWEMLGLKVEPVFGVRGRGDGREMFAMGDANIDYQTSFSYLKSVVPMVQSGQAVPMMTWGYLDEQGHIVRDPTFPDIPTFKEIYTIMHGREPSGAKWDAWKAFFVAGFHVQKMVFLPKGTSYDIIKMYTDAFAKIKTMPVFQASSKKHLGAYEQITQPRADAFLQQAINIPPDSKQYITRWLQERYGVILQR